MNRNILSVFCSILFIVCVSSLKSFSQLPYSTVQYTVRTQPGIDFDNQPNYCGRAQQLSLNIYKPIGDGNTERPVIIFIHGGAFTSTSDENDGDMVAMARQFASRGYVAASIHYREGIHLYNYPQGSPSLTATGFAAATFGLFSRSDVDRLFASDSMEVLRAGFRAQQDLKSAMRFMKARTATDSSSSCKFFIAGHSAGAIAVLGAAFLDDIAEKPAAVGALPNAVNPLWSNTFFQFFGPGGQDDLMYRNQNPSPFNFNAASCYVRADLGEIDGSGNANGQNLQILGIGSMAGAIQDTNILAGSNKPAIYMYHMPNDVVVPYNAGKPFGIAATFISPAPNERWPTVYGTNIIQNKLQSISYPTAYKVDTYDNGGDDFTSHSILPSTGVVSDSMARFFARVMDTSTRCVIVLPISLVFTGEKDGAAVALSWKVSSLTAPYSIVLERSADGINFSSIYSEVANTRRTYSYRDLAPLQMGYYRLKEISIDGKITYSNIIPIKLSTVFASTIFPNPAKTLFNVTLAKGNTGATASILLLTMNGEVIERKNSVAEGSTVYFNVANLAKGMYLCKIIHTGNVETLQVVVQ